MTIICSKSLFKIGKQNDIHCTNNYFEEWENSIQILDKNKRTETMKTIETSFITDKKANIDKPEIRLLIEEKEKNYIIFNKYFATNFASYIKICNKMPRNIYDEVIWKNIDCISDNKIIFSQEFPVNTRLCKTILTIPNKMNRNRKYDVNVRFCLCTNKCGCGISACYLNEIASSEFA